MIVKKEDLLVGDIIRSEYKDCEEFYKVVEISSEPVYSVPSLEEVYPIIVDGFVVENGKRLAPRKLPEDDDDFDVVYRENPEPYVSFSEELKKNRK